MRTLKYLVVAGMALCVASNAVAAPFTFSFQNITNENPTDAAIGEAQFFMDVDSLGPDVSFTIRNTGPDQSVITEVYFDDGSLLGISTIFDSPPTVDYVTGASPMDLPGGNLASPPFMATMGFLAEPTAPPPVSGVGPGESVTIVFSLIGGQTLADVISELNDGTLRAGIRGQAFLSGGSESYVSVPEPATLTLLVLGAGLFLRRRNHRA